MYNDLFSVADAVSMLKNGEIEIKIGGLDKIKDDGKSIVQKVVEPLGTALQKVQNTVDNNADSIKSVIECQEASESQSSANLDIQSEQLRVLKAILKSHKEYNIRSKRLEKKLDKVLGTKDKTSKKSKK